MNTCPKCGRQYSAPPAMSRIDTSEICPVCGSIEGLEAVGIEPTEELIEQLESAEIATGRVETRCGER